jgi:hypothetical protein
MKRDSSMFRTGEVRPSDDINYPHKRRRADRTGRWADQFLCKQLGKRSVKTVVSLGALSLPAEPKFERIVEAALLRIQEQARLQVKGREEGRSIYELLEPVEV